MYLDYEGLIKTADTINRLPFALKAACFWWMAVHPLTPN